VGRTARSDRRRARANRDAHAAHRLPHRASQDAPSVLSAAQYFGYTHWALGRALAELEQYDAAIASIRKAILLSGDSPDELAELARTLALSGRRAEALEVLDRVLRVSRRRYVSPTTFASIYAALGDREEAFAGLQQAYADRDFLLVMLRVDPMFDEVRNDPRFPLLLARMRYHRHFRDGRGGGGIDVHSENRQAAAPDRASRRQYLLGHGERLALLDLPARSNSSLVRMCADSSSG
jgi:tetratricopeptide (TPR) repeat protein